MAHHNLGNIDDMLLNKDMPFQQTEIKNEAVAEAEPVPAAPPAPAQVDYGLEQDIQSETLSPEPQEPQTEDIQASSEDTHEGTQENLDDYGNPKPPPKTYSQEEADRYADEYANRMVRDRLARIEKNQPRQPELNQVNQQQGEETWEAQLEKFVENVNAKQQQKAYEQAYQAREQQAQAEFQQKFQAGRAKFSDFDAVVSPMPITDVMAHALRAFSDPGSFIYAASKRVPQEIERISKETDPYKQIVELGKLEERMRQPKLKNTNAPKPIGRTPEDTTIVEKKAQKRETTIEEMILKDQERRIAMMRARRGR